MQKHFNSFQLFVAGAFMAGIALLLMLGSQLAYTQDPGGTPAPGTLIESDDASVQRSGNWTAVETAAASGGSYLYSSGSADDVLSITFEGAAFEIIFVKHAALAGLAIEVDNVVLRTLDTQAAETLFNQRTAIDYLNHGRHVLRVYGVGGPVAIDAFRLLPVEEPRVPPSNDNWANATNFSTIPQLWSQSTAEATKAGTDPTPSCQSSFDKTVWYKYTAPNNTPLQFATATSDFDTVVAVYTGASATTLTEVACDDDNNGNRQSTVVILPTPGVTYYIMVAGWSGASGTLVLQGSFATAPAVSNPTAPNSAITSVANLHATFTWTEQPNATWYRVYISGPNGFVLDQWFNESSVCADFIGTCNKVIELYANGGYTWWVNNWGPGGFGPWSSGLNFSINIAAPSTVIKTGPGSGSTDTDGNVTFTWTHQPDTGMWYHFTLNGPSAHDQWYYRGDICAGATCSITRNALQNGAYTWNVQAWSPGGFSPNAAAFNLTIAIPPPALITQVSPSGAISEVAPLLVWQPDAQALWYNVVLTNTGTNSTVFDSWYEGVSVCSGGLCFIPTPSPLDGSFNWKVRGWGNGGFGNFGAGLNFSTSILNAMNHPASTVSGRYLTFNWDTMGSATTWYQIWVGTSTFTQVHNLWYEAAKVCKNGVTCSFTLPSTMTTALAAGNYVWYIQPYGVSYGLGQWSPGRNFTVGTDTDNDGLADVEETAYSTNPNNKDTDGDALLDGWEVHGLNAENLALVGANPRHKDIFVEMDYMVRASATNGLGPNQNVVDAIIAAFAASPMTNPDGVTGVNIHLELSNEVPYDNDLNPYINEFYAIKGNPTNWDPGRTDIYHYMIWANGYGGGSSSGVSMGIPAADFLVTLGLWNGGAGGTDDQKIGTFIHELGHNLGLTHGGNDHVNYKPNYLSVMNYFFQVIGVYRNGSWGNFDYQRFSLPSLSEGSLNENAGINNAGLTNGYRTRWYCPNVTIAEADATGAIDWNCNGNATNNPVSVDLNNDGGLQTLGTQDNWANIIFNGGGIGSGVATLVEQRLNAERFQQTNPEPELDIPTWTRLNPDPTAVIKP